MEISNQTSLYLTTRGLVVCFVLFAVIFVTMGFMAGLIYSPEVSDNHVKSLQHAADYARWDAEAAKWEAASRVFVPEINLEGVKQ